MKRLLPAMPSSKHLRKNNIAISPVIGVILLILLTILLAGITVSAVYGKDYSTSLEPAPMAVIEIESVVGGVPYIGYPYGIRYEKNFIVLQHKSGDPLDVDSTYLIITGEGASTIGTRPRYAIPKGEIVVIYGNLDYGGKERPYKTRNPDISDGMWSAGERLVFNGYDSIDGTARSSVHVTINGISNTYNNYGLKENSVITIKIFDRKSNKIIAEAKYKVTPAK
ncbi:type IV pilin [Methanolobus chelungpuianus]|uniref:type IV pilin n=1 Tax=Methanolobus chelungpuianus TaxID=502115 RepID=UPI002115A8E3|nr:type IV pilin [Methanolobus chelungpuianus]